MQATSFELKHDERSGQWCTVRTANAEDLSIASSNQLRFKSLQENLARLQVQKRDHRWRDHLHLMVTASAGSMSAFLDRKHESVLYAFDLLWINRVGLRRRPLLKRKKRLERLGRTSGLRLMYAQHVEKDGKDLFRERVREDQEGIVPKT